MKQKKEVLTKVLLQSPQNNSRRTKNEKGVFMETLTVIIVVFVSLAVMPFAIYLMMEVAVALFCYTLMVALSPFMFLVWISKKIKAMRC